MTTLEYMERKNKIVFDFTGIVLIPKDQLEDVKEMYGIKLVRQRTRSVITDADICPYCIAYDKCINCPMSLANNKCGNDYANNTYHEVMCALKEVWPTKEHVSIKDIPGILGLVKEYNTSIDEKENDEK